MPSMSNETDSTEEWWFEVRPKGVGGKQPSPIGEICSVSSDWSSSPDVASARWYETFATNVASSQSTRRSRQESRCPGGDLMARVPTDRCLVDAVAGDQNADRHLDTDIGVRVMSQLFFLGGRVV